MRIFLLCIFILQSFLLFGQTKSSLSGRITDKNTNEPLIGATVSISGTTKGSITNEQGYYTLHIKSGNYNICASYLGYRSDTNYIEHSGAIILNFSLSSISIVTEEIVVTARNYEENIRGVETGEIRLTLKEIKKLPALMGESDFLRIIKLTPGIQSAGDANSGFYVRGGGADQNLIMLDKVTIYNPSHVMGFFSVFNADAIRSTTLIKSGMPASYGGRLSSIIDVASEDGNFKNFELSGNIGLLSSKLTLQGPIIEDKISVLLTGRRSYIDEAIKPIINRSVERASNFYRYSKYHFYDINAKVAYNYNNKNKLYFTYYQGKDVYSLEKLQIKFKNNMRWGNRVMALNWIHTFNNHWSIRNTFGRTDYCFILDASQQDVDIELLSAITDNSFKSELTKASSNGQIIKLGVEYQFHKFKPNNLEATASDVDLKFGANKYLNSHETSLFYNHEFDLSGKLRFNTGLRFTNYMHVGPYYQMNKNDIGEVTDTTYYAGNETIKTYNNLEPRISARYQINCLSSVKASFTINNQYVHLASSSAVTLPTDVWLPSTNFIKPQRGTQYTLGYFRNLSNSKYITSINVYYKDFFNQIELLNGIINNFHDNIFEESIVVGKGNSYGSELYVHKTSGRLQGWIGYTLSWTNKQFDEINEGKIYPAKYDRRHDINIVASFAINERWDASATFIFGSGNAVTLPEYKYIMEGNIISGYGPTNSFRMPAYHRLDLSVNYYFKKSGNFESSLNFSVFNVYNRANPFFIYFEITGNVYEYNIEITPKQISLFPILPSITWNFRF